jgi:hypothetical protein
MRPGSGLTEVPALPKAPAQSCTTKSASAILYQVQSDSDPNRTAAIAATDKQTTIAILTNFRIGNPVPAAQKISDQLLNSFC